MTDYLLLFLSFLSIGLTCFIVWAHGPLQDFKSYLGLGAGRHMEMMSDDEGKYSYFLKNFVELFNCPYCLGFYIGILNYAIAIFMGLINAPILEFYVVDCVAFGMFVSLSSAWIKSNVGA